MQKCTNPNPKSNTLFAKLISVCSVVLVVVFVVVVFVFVFLQVFIFGFYLWDVYHKIMVGVSCYSKAI